MAIFRVEKNNNYTTLSNYHLRDKKISLKAKGLLSFMLSLPDDWDYSLNGLESVLNEGETAIKSALKELEGSGYLKIEKFRNAKGQFEYVYNIFEQPILNDLIEENIEKPKADTPIEEKPHIENPDMEVSQVENQTQINTNNKILNNKILNNKYNDRLNEFNLSNNFDKNVICECISKSTGEKCKRRSSYCINGKNYCNQHSRTIIDKYLGKRSKNKEFEKIIDENFSDKELKNVIYDFIEMRKAIKKPMTIKALKLIIKKLNKLSTKKEEQILILENSIVNSWQGIFPLKDEQLKEIETQKKEYKIVNMTEEEYYKKNGGKKNYG